MNERFLLIMYEAYCKSCGPRWIEPTDETIEGFKVWLKNEVERPLGAHEEQGLTLLRKVLVA